MTNAAFLLRRSSDTLDPRATEQLEIIEDEIKRSASIITELLDYAKLAEGTIQRVLVNEALDEAVSALKHELSSRGVEVNKDYSLDLPFLFIDPAQLRQVFINLLLNSCEAIATDGGISITTSYSRDGFIEVSVSDTGTGMPPEVAANIFKPFYTTKDKGTGMGLAIAQNVVRAYRGQVRVESTPGVGTTFHLRFPTRMAMLKQMPPSPSRSDTRSAPATPVPTSGAT
jgi:signal transduction histidine kinase